MQQSAVGSFLRFLAGFVTFISISFGVTYAVTVYAVAQEKNQQAAAAVALLLEQK